MFAFQSKFLPYSTFHKCRSCTTYHTSTVILLNENPLAVHKCRSQVSMDKMPLCQVYIEFYLLLNPHLFTL